MFDEKLFLSATVFVYPHKVELWVTRGNNHSDKVITRQEWEDEKEWIEESLGSRNWYVDTSQPPLVYMSIFGSVKEK